MMKKLNSFFNPILEEVKSNKILFYILLFNFILHFIGISWGLPNVVTWAPDAVAPHRVLRGLINGFSFGYYDDYPIFHMLLLAILYLPVIFIRIIDVYFNNDFITLNNFFMKLKETQFFLKTDIFSKDILPFDSLISIEAYRTTLIIISRFVTIIMSLGVIYLIYLCVKKVFDKRTALFSIFIISFNPIFNYYSHFSNLDVPYIFWSLLAIYNLINIIETNKTKYYIYFAIFINISVITKDQAYALYILPIIIYLIIPFIKHLFNRQKKIPVKPDDNFIIKNFIYFSITFLISFIITQNLLFNFSAFISRVKRLIGPISWTEYTKDIYGILRFTYDIFINFIDMENIYFAFLIITGIIYIIILYKKDLFKSNRKLIFFYFSLSFTIFLNYVVLRGEYKHLLPQSILLSIYEGFLLSSIYNIIKNTKYKIIAIPFFILITIYPFYLTIQVNINLIYDIRYKAKEWIEANIKEGSSIEVYSWFHDLPNIDNKKYNYYCIENDYSDIEKRNPDYIILTSLGLIQYHDKSNFYIEKGKKIADMTKKDIEKGLPILLYDLLYEKSNYKIEKIFKHRLPFFDKWHHVIIRQIIILKRIE